jgi:hypothetical protein
MQLTQDRELIPFDAEIGYESNVRSCVACVESLCGVCQLKRDSQLRSTIVADLCKNYSTGFEEF